MQAWYDGVIIKSERKSHSHPRPSGGTYHECHCKYAIRFCPAIDTTDQEPPTFVKVVRGTRNLAFISYANGSISDVISGRIRKEDLRQSWEPDFRVDVSRYLRDVRVDSPQNPVRRGEQNRSTEPVQKSETPRSVSAFPAPDTPARGSEYDNALGSGGSQSEGGLGANEKDGSLRPLPQTEVELETGSAKVFGAGSQPLRSEDVSGSETTAHIGAMTGSRGLEAGDGVGGLWGDPPGLSDQEDDVTGGEHRDTNGPSVRNGPQGGCVATAKAVMKRTRRALKCGRFNQLPARLEKPRWAVKRGKLPARMATPNARS